MAVLSTILCLATALLSVSSPVLASLPSSPIVSTGLQQILDKAHQGQFDYRTSFTQDIFPKGIHSHNDYWRAVPFYTGLSVGAISTESDVWLINSTLYVGHEQSALTPARTFESLYVNPIMDVLKRQNPTSSFVTSKTRNGVFDTDSSQTLYLFVDLKTDGATTWPYVLKALEPLRAAGYLSTADEQTFTSGPVTVIGTGNTPLSAVQNLATRDAFYDAPVATLNTTFSNITSLVSPIASGNFADIFGDVLGTGLNDTQLEILRQQVAVGKEKGIMLRYWNQPGWPISTRNAIWRQLRTAGVQLLNADDVDAAAGLGDEW